MSARVRSVLALCAVAGLTALAATPAAADHSDPSQPLAPIVPLAPEATTTGEGTWQHIKSFGGTTGTDIEFFHRGGALYASGGSLGQARPAIVGQRILKLLDADGTVAPEFVADHGSAWCGDVSNVSATTGLQHDVQVTPRKLYPAVKSNYRPEGELVIDTVDALGRCHDAGGGGLELVDVSGVGKPGFQPREVHLTRHNGFSHTVTVDATRPWIVYNSTSDFGTNPDAENKLGIGRAWIDVLDIRTCLRSQGLSLEQKRARCRPKVFRIPFKYDWAAQVLPDGTMRQPSACHDITARPGRIYCAAVNATLVFDVSGLTKLQSGMPSPNDRRGDIRGKPLPCKVVDAVPAAQTAPTKAKVTDCSLGGPNADVPTSIAAYAKAKRPKAEGWKFLGTVRHAGRYDQTGGNGGNTNTAVRSDEGISVAHEADPTPDGRHMFVTDERGGGVVPPGATCAPSLDNPYGNGGIHVFDLRKKDKQGNFEYARLTDGRKAVYIAPAHTPSATFCTVHVIEQVPDERRLMTAWYTQGIKIIDYDIDAKGRFTFRETASYTLHPNNIWVAEHFKIVDNADGTRTYYFLTNDITRGMDVVSWTSKPHKMGSRKTAAVGGGFGSGGPLSTGQLDVLLLTSTTAVLAAATVLRRRRPSLATV